MNPSRFLATVLLITCAASLQAVENDPYPSGSAYYNTNNNISSALSSWTNANSWGGGNTNTGWNYVGQVGGANDASGVYLGNGWVITAGHVGPHDFTLDANTYAYTGYSYTNFTYTNGQTTEYADINLFRVATTSTVGNSLLPTNNISLVPNYKVSGNTVVMIGNGDSDAGRQKSWGINTVTANNFLLPLGGGSPYTSVDFETAYGTNAYGTTNTATLVNGDSGGGDFAYGGTNWYLIGINEALSGKDSYFVNLGYYQPQIQTVMASAVPEPSTYGLMALGLGAIRLSLWRNRRSSTQ